MNKLLEYIHKIEQRKRNVIARYLIIVGILMAYSPYWTKLFLEDLNYAVKVSDNIVFFGWWVLAPGLVLYFLNIWLNYKASIADKNISE